MRHRRCIQRSERKSGENGNAEANGSHGFRYMREEPKRYWPKKVAWVGVNRMTSINVSEDSSE